MVSYQNLTGNISAAVLVDCINSRFATQEYHSETAKKHCLPKVLAWLITGRQRTLLRVRWNRSQRRVRKRKLNFQEMHFHQYLYLFSLSNRCNCSPTDISKIKFVDYLFSPNYFEDRITKGKTYATWSWTWFCRFRALQLKDLSSVRPKQRPNFCHQMISFRTLVNHLFFVRIEDDYRCDNLVSQHYEDLLQNKYRNCGNFNGFLAFFNKSTSNFFNEL